MLLAHWKVEVVERIGMEVDGRKIRTFTIREFRKIPPTLIIVDKALMCSMDR